MRMIPERPRLIGNGEIVRERMARHDWALTNERRAVRPNRAPLEHTVPVLQRFVSPSIENLRGLNDRCAQLHGIVHQTVGDIDLEPVAL